MCILNAINYIYIYIYIYIYRQVWGYIYIYYYYFCYYTFFLHSSDCIRSNQSFFNIRICLFLDFYFFVFSQYLINIDFIDSIILMAFVLMLSWLAVVSGGHGYWKRLFMLDLPETKWRLVKYLLYAIEMFLHLFVFFLVRIEWPLTEKNMLFEKDTTSSTRG